MTPVVFVNPCAGGGRAGRKIERVRTAFAARNFAVEFVKTDSGEAFRGRVRDAIAAGCKTLIAMGGDGTLQLLVREAIGCPVCFGVIPAGGGNDFAAALGIHTWEDSVEAITAGAYREVDVVRVKFANGEQAVYLGGGGCGLDAEAMRHASGRFLHWPGRLRYIAAALTAFRKYPGVRIEAEFGDGETPRIERQALLSAVLNTPSYGGGLRLAPGARIDDGALDVVILGMLSGGEVARLLFRLVLTGELRTARQEHIQTRAVRLTGPPETLFHGDGEILGNLPVEIEAVPGAVKFFAPASS